MTVTAVPPFSNADKAGLCPGDRIVKLCNRIVDRCKKEDIDRILAKELHISMDIERLAASGAFPTSSKVSDVIGSRPSDHYFRSVCLSVCLCRVFLSSL